MEVFTHRGLDLVFRFSPNIDKLILAFFSGDPAFFKAAFNGVSGFIGCRNQTVLDRGWGHISNRDRNP